MPEELKNEYRHAKTASLVGSICMYLMALFCLAILAIFCIMGPSEPIGTFLSEAASLVTILVSVVYLAQFLRHFAAGSTPFGRAQSRRLIVASVFLALRAAMDSHLPVFSYINQPSHQNVLQGTGGLQGIDLKVVVMVVFLACLAMVVRYGNVLKEDSDSFL